MLYTETDDDVARLLRALDWHAHHEPVCMAGVSETAVGRIGRFLSEAQHADPARFGLPPRGDGAARKGLRYLCALIPDSVPDHKVVDEVHAVLANPGMSLLDVAVVVGEAGAEPPRGESRGLQIRQTGVLLRAGADKVAVEREVGMHRRIVTEIAQFLGSSEAQREAQWELAFQFIERGEASPQVFADEAGVPLRRAKELLRQVRAGLEES